MMNYMLEEIADRVRINKIGIPYIFDDSKNLQHFNATVVENLQILFKKEYTLNDENISEDKYVVLTQEIGKNRKINVKYLTVTNETENILRELEYSMINGKVTLSKNTVQFLTDKEG